MRVRVIDLAPLKDFITKEDMRAAGEFAISTQADRIASGVGQRGKPMKKLSKDYADEEKGGSRVRRLFRTGSMLASRSIVYLSAYMVRIGFARKGPKNVNGSLANIHQAWTPFVKATRDEKESVLDFIDKRVRKRLNRQLAIARAKNAAKEIR